MKKSLHRQLHNQKGLVTVDYLVAFVLVGAFSFLIFSLSLSLSVVEIVQYMTFASARSYYAGNIDPQAQYVSGNMKFNELANNPVLSPLFRNGWFSLDVNAMTVGSIPKSPNPDFNRYKQQPDSENLFHGTVVGLTLNVLDFNVPFFGSTSTGEENGRKKPFSSYVGSYLGREVSFRECENFMLDRFSAIKALANRQGAQPYATVQTRYEYIPPDNGC